MPDSSAHTAVAAGAGAFAVSHRCSMAGPVLGMGRCRDRYVGTGHYVPMTTVVAGEWGRIHGREPTDSLGGT